ncbi:MAG: DUF4011 domain-containing protein [Holosporales bacterium]|jgi:superfamily I DNA and/or RNA helicase/very-short-patch-repair endonuclease|nr:DUF4011 domain-containing protein [Holosporales bacterium]
MVNIEQNIRARIVKWKKLLLDMTKRNRLLWYKAYKVGTLKLERGIFDKEISSIHAIIKSLAFNNGVIEFIADPTISRNGSQRSFVFFAETNDGNEDDEDDEDDDDIENEEKRREMIKARTKSLLNISRKIKSEYEERGLNIGYIALGFLKWYEREDANTEVKSPLIMIPIKIEQEGRYAPFRVSLNTDEQILLNPVIEKKFETDFPSIFAGLPAAFDNSSAVDEFFRLINVKIADQLYWSIENEAVLDTFSFLNLAIWNDLDKNGELVVNNPLSRVLAGSERIDEGFVYEEGNLDLDNVEAKNNLNIYEVDSSQQEAIYRAKKGESFVIQGPPGTGKSQTITNIIAELLYLGKKVLFVSEKQAALDVVYNKLAKRKLDDFCLILHNSNQRKADIREQLKKSYEIAHNRISVSEQSLQKYDDLDKVRGKLNLYSEELHRQYNDNTTAYILMGELNKLENTKDLAFNMPDDFEWNSDYDTVIKDIFTKVDNYGKSFIDNTKHFDNNFWQFYTGSFTNSTRREVQEKIRNITPRILSERTENVTFENILYRISEYFSLMNDIPFKQADCEELVKITHQIETEISTIKELEKSIRELQSQNEKLRCELVFSFTDDFLEFDQAQVYYKKLINKYRSFFIRWISSDYRALLKTLKKYRVRKLNYADYVKYIELLVNFRNNLRTINDYSSSISLSQKKKKRNFTIIKRLLSDKNKEIAALLEGIDFETLAEYQSYFEARRILLKNYELDDFVEKIETQDNLLPANEIGNIFKKRFLTLLLERTDFDKKYSNYSEKEHNHDADIFREYDKQTLDISAARIKCELVSKMPHFSSFTNRIQGDERSLLERELKKQSRLMPTRKLIKALPVILPLLKPCMMMSPLTVSSYLGDNPDWKFDVIIFDEASQVKPEHAITSIIRGSQVIVAGDSKQMPPTTFFDSNDEDEDYEENNLHTTNLESILDEMSSCFPDVYLNWHYRSKDESLIAFSNKKFYSNRLSTFPSPMTNNEKIGVNFVYCQEGIWESKNGNKSEAEQVARLVFEHIREHPKQSLGVVAFGKSQEYAIEEAVNKLRDLHQRHEKFFSDLKPEPFFIKNLENVQGDERDRIILSCGYGKTKKGDPSSFAMRFGPLTIEGGERRLNVAISRAKRSMTIVSSFKAFEIRETEVNPRRKLLRDFIEYAERGIVALLGDTDVDPTNYTPEFDSGFEENVYYFLKDKGYKLRTQVGTSGYKIDMAIQHPEIDERFVLAIECDGASYHSSRTARDRDILRQEILENLGWTFYRIWSTDWFRDNINEKKRLIEAINCAIKNYNSGPSSDENICFSSKSNAEKDSEIKLASDNTKSKLDQIYSGWQLALMKRYGNWSYGDKWNSLDVMKNCNAIELIMGDILEYTNGLSPEVVFREINERVFEKARYTKPVHRIYRDKFNSNFVKTNQVEIINGIIRLKSSSR